MNKLTEILQDPKYDTAMKLTWVIDGKEYGWEKAHAILDWIDKEIIGEDEPYDAEYRNDIPTTSTIQGLTKQKLRAEMRKKLGL